MAPRPTINQRVRVVISAFEPGREKGCGITREELTIDIDGARPGGFKSQEADIESQCVAALNRVLESLSRDREYGHGA
jgi:hypothetical protein